MAGRVGPPLRRPAGPHRVPEPSADAAMLVARSGLFPSSRYERFIKATMERAQSALATNRASWHAKRPGVVGTSAAPRASRGGRMGVDTRGLCSSWNHW